MNLGERMVDWKLLINSYKNDVDTTGKGPPEIEMVKEFAPSDDDEDGSLKETDMLFVQKVITEVYIYTNVSGRSFGEHTFQDMVILGEMTKAKLSKLLERQKDKRDKQKGS